jgi:two-component system phosphate regulon sensor histidine kinase PhoR
MTKVKSYRHRLFLYYFSIFILFTIAVLTFQYHREKKIRTDALDSRLNDMVQLVDNYIRANSIIESGNYHLIDSVFNLMPVPDLRITIIAADGKVMYDSSVEDWSIMDNHLSRPEVKRSRAAPFGTMIRTSATTGKDYYYFSRYYNSYYIRLAEEYNLRVRGSLKFETGFITFMIILFAAIWALLQLVTSRMSQSITMLRDFAAMVRRGQGNDPSVVFPKNEIGETGKEIVRIYNNLVKNTAELELQKEKLFRHLDVLNEGVAFFSADHTLTLSNSHFVEFLNAITGDTPGKPEGFLDHPLFSGIRTFIDGHRQSGGKRHDTPSTELRIEKSGRFFGARCILFNDDSYEIILTDITRTEQTKTMRQQMTSNIAHELKTPIASVRGYLETLMVNTDLPEDKKLYFLDKALAQSTRLTDLISDIVTLNKLDEAGSSYTFEKVDVDEIIHEVHDNLLTTINKRKIKVEIAINPGTVINANRSLIVSVFQNLMENAIAYAGENITIEVKSLPAETGYHCFSFADNGVGIPAEHQPRIFERFYRIDDGRSRKSGGTGLGLSIVKNAILLHKGDISVRTPEGGGTEFLITIPV